MAASDGQQGTESSTTHLQARQSCRLIFTGAAGSAGPVAVLSSGGWRCTARLLLSCTVPASCGFRTCEPPERPTHACDSEADASTPAGGWALHAGAPPSRHPRA